MKWDIIKCKIRGFTLEYAKRKARERREKEKELTQMVGKLHTDMATSPSDEIKNRIDLVQAELDEIYNRQTEGVMIRSHAIWCEQGEKSTKYFLSLEKRNYKRKCITKLINANGREIEDFQEILQEEKVFYENLYSSKIDPSEPENPIFYDLFDNPFIQKLSDDEKSKCNEKITGSECVNALKHFKNNKSPGCDGFSAEFYKFFWTDIESLVIDSFNFAYEKGLLSVDQRRSVISLIPKKDKNLLHLKTGGHYHY